MLNQEILMKPRELKKELESLVMKYETLKASVERTVAIISLTPGHGQGVSRRLEDLEIEIVDLEKKLYEKKQELLDTQAEAKQYILQLPNQSAVDFLIRRYVDCMTWDEIAKELNYSTRYCREKALNTIKNADALP